MTINLEVNVAGRFKVVDQPYASPSKCAFCGIGHNQEGKVMFIDTTLDLDYYGVVYICSNCLLEISTSLGYMSPLQYKELRNSYQEVYDENDRLAAENEGFRSAIATLTGHRCYSITFSKPTFPEAETETPDDESPSGITEGIESSKSEPDAPSSEQGFSDVRGTSESSKSDSKSRKPVKPLDLDLDL